MKNVPVISALLTGLWLLAAPSMPSCQAIPPDSAKPANYDEIKTLLDSFASAVDNYGEPRVGLTVLLAKGDEETFALIELLREKIRTRGFPQEKSAIVSILAHNKSTDKKRSAKLLAETLPEKLEDRNGQWWIVEAIRFFVNVDPDLGRSVALKGLSGRISEVTYAAIKALEAVGKADDVKALESFRTTWNAHLSEVGIATYSDRDELSGPISEAEAKISKREPYD